MQLRDLINNITEMRCPICGHLVSLPFVPLGYVRCLLTCEHCLKKGIVSMWWSDEFFNDGKKVRRYIQCN